MKIEHRFFSNFFFLEIFILSFNPMHKIWNIFIGGISKNQRRVKKNRNNNKIYLSNDIAGGDIHNNTKIFKSSCCSNSVTTVHVVRDKTKQKKVIHGREPFISNHLSYKNLISSHQCISIIQQKIRFFFVFVSSTYEIFFFNHKWRRRTKWCTLSK